MDAIFQRLLETAQENGLEITDERFAKLEAKLMDERDPLKHFRSQFHVPTKAEALEDDLADGKAEVVLTLCQCGFVSLMYITMNRSSCTYIFRLNGSPLFVCCIRVF